MRQVTLFALLWICIFVRLGPELAEKSGRDNDYRRVAAYEVGDAGELIVWETNERLFPIIIYAPGQWLMVRECPDEACEPAAEEKEQ